MHHFTYKNDNLYCEDVAVRSIADALGTPFYLYSHATLCRHYNSFNDAFEGIDRLVCFSAKANTNLSILSLFRQLGSGLDIVSGGELFKGLKAGYPPDKIVYSGVGKRIDEIDYALSEEILIFNVESMEELDVINARAGELKKTADIAIRVNPDVDPGTHPYISTGLSKNKFGIDTAGAVEVYKAAAGLKNVNPVGLDCHIGSQITEVAPFKDALVSLCGLIDALEETGIHIKYLDMGGGLGITYGEETPPEPDEYARAIAASLNGRDLKLILEPGRVIVGNAGILVTKVLYRKQGKKKEFIITDAGMNDLMRPSLYNAYHAIIPVVKNSKDTIVADVVGPICESGDFLAQERPIHNVQSGDLLAVMSTGAYGFAMSSNYCSRLRVAEVMVRGTEHSVIRSRETYPDLIEGENIPSFLIGC
ncbi:MAG: diaminopimelate decarboxylase [Desulfobacteraceae bacterium]|nr:diaminopimelate decarboxylase [Desulfobacteraceae bacterium]